MTDTTEKQPRKTLKLKEGTEHKSKHAPKHEKLKAAPVARAAVKRAPKPAKTSEQDVAVAPPTSLHDALSRASAEFAPDASMMFRNSNRTWSMKRKLSRAEKQQAALLYISQLRNGMREAKKRWNQLPREQRLVEALVNLRLPQRRVDASHG